MAVSSLKRLLIVGALLLLVSGASAQNRGVSPLLSSVPGVEGRYYALIIGNNDYQHWRPLQTAVRDAEQLRDVLVRRYTFPAEQVLLLKNATRVDLLRGFDWLKERSTPEDRVLIYYAGHGEYDEREDGYWVPVEASTENRYSHVSNSDVLNQIRAIEARHKLLIADSCFSGNLLTRGAVRNPDPDWSEERYFQEKNRLNAVMGLTSGGNEPVSDGGARWGGNSIFAYHLLAQLQANEAPYLSASELALSLTRYVANDTLSATGSQQTPVFQAINNQGHQGGEFFFIRQPEAVSRTLMAYLPAVDGSFGPVQHAAQDTLESWLAGQKEELPTATLDSLETLRRQLIRQGQKQALVWRLKGWNEETASLLWQGVTRLEVQMTVYVLQNGRLQQVDQFELTGERLPYQTPPASPAAQEEQYQRVALKILEHAPENGMQAFVRKVLD